MVVRLVDEEEEPPPLIGPPPPPRLGGIMGGGRKSKEVRNRRDSLKILKLKARIKNVLYRCVDPSMALVFMSSRCQDKSSKLIPGMKK